MGLLFLEGQQRIGHRLGHGPRAADIGAWFGQECIEAPATPGLEPVAQGFGGDAAAARSGDGVVLGGLLAQQRIQPGVARGQMGELGDQAVAEQRDGLGRWLGIGGIRHGAKLREVGECPGYAGALGGSGPMSCWRPPGRAQGAPPR